MGTGVHQEPLAEEVGASVKTLPIHRNISFLADHGWSQFTKYAWNHRHEKLGGGGKDGEEKIPAWRLGRSDRWVEVEECQGRDGCTRTKVWFWGKGGTIQKSYVQANIYPIAVAGYESRRGSLKLINGCSLFGKDELKFPYLIDSFEALHHRAVVWILNGSVPRRVGAIKQPTKQEEVCS